MVLYSDHATSEQFHSEFKTDLDLERLPSGKFDTRGSIPLLRTCQKRRLNTSKGEGWSICLNVRFATVAPSMNLFSEVFWFRSVQRSDFDRPDFLPNLCGHTMDTIWTQPIKKDLRFHTSP